MNFIQFNYLASPMIQLDMEIVFCRIWLQKNRVLSLRRSYRSSSEEGLELGYSLLQSNMPNQQYLLECLLLNRCAYEQLH